MIDPVGVLVLIQAAEVIAQFTSGGPTQPGLPDGCVGSYPNITLCRQVNWFLGDNAVDICKPLGQIPIPSQTVYIQDELNFCINLPNPDSIFLQNNYYLVGNYPRIVDAEGFLQTYCLGSYMPQGAKPLPVGAILSSHVVKNFTIPGQRYYQIHGTMDCDILKINCTRSAPDKFDDGGQYDNAPYVSCGKEPYSGVDTSTNGNPGFENYVEKAGDGQFCMRICEPKTQHLGLPCDVTQDSIGCEVFMGVEFTPGFDYTDAATGQVTTASVFVPPATTTTVSTVVTTAGSVTFASGTNWAASSTPVPLGTSGSPAAVTLTKTASTLKLLSSFAVSLTIVLVA